MIKAEVIADSKNSQGNRITSFVVQFPRIVLAELNTHRALSRNSASSRAVPFEKMLKRVTEEPFIPMAWQKDHPGMQGTEYFTDKEEVEGLKYVWLKARDNAIERAKDLSFGVGVVDGTGKFAGNTGVTKQLCNRLLEPFMYHTAIVTATEFENFFYLRCPQYQLDEVLFRSRKDYIKSLKNEFEAKHGVGGEWSGHGSYTISKTTYHPHFNIPNNDIDWLKINQGKGEIHIMALAEAMWDAYNESTPKELKVGEWHIPFGDRIDEDRLYQAIKDSYPSGTYEYFKVPYKVFISTARNARVSYINYEGKDDYHADIKLHDNLSMAGHWSCFEHCAQVMDPDKRTQWSGNFQGFIQYRKMFDNENKV